MWGSERGRNSGGYPLFSPRQLITNTALVTQSSTRMTDGHGCCVNTLQVCSRCLAGVSGSEPRWVCGERLTDNRKQRRVLFSPPDLYSNLESFANNKQCTCSRDDGYQEGGANSDLGYPSAREAYSDLGCPQRELTQT